MPRKKTVTYEIRLLCSVYEDHCETRLLRIKCGNYADCQWTNARVERAIVSAKQGNFAKLRRFFGEDVQFAGTEYPFVFDYQGMFRIVEDSIPVTTPKAPRI